MKRKQIKTETPLWLEIMQLIFGLIVCLSIVGLIMGRAIYQLFL